MPTEFIIPNASGHEMLEFESVLALEEFVQIPANGIKVKLCVKASFNGDELKESKPTVKLVKCPPIWLAFDDAANGRDGVPQYAVVVDKYTWDNCSAEDRKRLIHLGLSQIQVDIKDDGSFKVKRRHPDVVTYSTTVQRYGLDTSERDALRIDSAVARGARLAAHAVTGAGRDAQGRGRERGQERNPLTITDGEEE